MRSRIRNFVALACIVGMPGPGLPLLAPATPLGIAAAESHLQVCRPGERSNTPFGKVVDLDEIELRGGGRLVPNIIPAIEGPEPASVRLQVEARPSHGADWTLQIRDSKLRLVASIRARDFLDDDASTIWTGRLEVPQVGAELVRATPNEVVRIRKAIVYDQVGAGGKLFSTQSAQPNWSDLHPNSPIDRIREGDSVGMMVGGGFDPQLRRTSWCCSGIMLTPTLYLTNWHCGGSEGIVRFWGDEACAATLIDLAWDAGSRNRQYRCIKVLHQNQALDFALLRVRAISGPGGDDLEVRRPRFAATAASENQSLFMIHHPVCKPKQISAQNCKVKRVSLPSWRAGPNGSRPNSDISHVCDSEAGSSGAPMFNEAGEIVALHHLGFEVDGHCRPIEPRVNKAVSIQVILADIRSARPEIAAEIAR